MTAHVSIPVPSSRRDRVGNRVPIAALAGWALLALVFANTWWFAYTASNPVVASDAWHFVESFVPHALDGTVGLAELYAKRDGFDHAQPLHKLFLMFNARYLGLDFTYEALAGVLAGIAGVLVMKRAIDRERPQAARHAAYWLLLAAIAAVYLSLNSSMVFTWPLVAFGYVTTLVVLLTILIGWLAWERRAPWAFAIAMGLCAALTDDSGLLLAVALAAGFAWAGWHERRLRDAAVFGVLGIAMVAIYLGVYAAFDTTPRGPAPAAGEQVARILAELQGPEGWRVITPFASGIAYFGQLQGWFGDGWERVQLGLGLAMLAGHALFWWHALRRPPAAATFMAIVLMLLFYAYVAGIIYGRVPIAGLRYLNEPRYAVLYGLQLVAMLLLIAARAPRAADDAALPRGSVAAGTFAVALLALQAALATASWKERPYNLAYWDTMAGQTLRLGREPWRTPRACQPMLVVCEWHPARRKIVIELLQRYRLNVFSERFRARHGFDD